MNSGFFRTFKVVAAVHIAVILGLAMMAGWRGVRMVGRPARVRRLARACRRTTTWLR